MRAAATLLVAFALGGCAGASDEPAGEQTPAEARAELEQRLARSSIGVCDGECRTYMARSAACGMEAVELEGRTWFRCRVAYRPRDGSAPSPDEFCAALDDHDSHLARPADECVPG